MISPYDDGWLLNMEPIAPPPFVNAHGCPTRELSKLEFLAIFCNERRRVDPPSGCEQCGRHLYFSQRAAKHRWCWPCAAYAGVVQMHSSTDNLIDRALRIPFAWWRWTVYLGHALVWRKEAT